MTKILVVDDKPDLREILEYNLKNAGYEVLTAASAEEAMEILPSDCALILLDVMLGGISGFKMAHLLRTQYNNQVPIIFLTAKDTENDLLTGFSAGGDDYISKPFSIQEVLARIKALLKRSAVGGGVFADQNTQTNTLTIDDKRKTVRVGDEEIRLSAKDLAILSLLVRNKGRIFSRQEILAEVWKGESFVLERTVDVHLAHIRHSLGKKAGCLHGHHGFGYSFEEE